MCAAACRSGLDGVAQWRPLRSDRPAAGAVPWISDSAVIRTMAPWVPRGRKLGDDLAANGLRRPRHTDVDQHPDAMKERAFAPRDSHPRATLGLFTSTTTREALWTSMTAGSLSGCKYLVIPWAGVPSPSARRW